MVRTSDIDPTMTMDTELTAGLGRLVERFDHVSMAVRDIDAASGFIALVAGERFDSGLNAGGDFHWAQFHLPGGGTLEMISAADKDDPSHFINRFINERGEGLHHLTFKVTDIRAAAAAATELGFVVFGLDDSDPTWKEAFVHPKSAHGVLVQLAEFPHDFH
ncbi:MAG: VOC family protein [Acidimicrobiia bacterium]|nr:VOC family protein [Acidimicrobiia bacterium]